MKKDEVFELIHKNGSGENILCVFNSKGLDNKGYVSNVINYKYQKGLIKIYMDRYHVEMHDKNLARSPYCEFIIKEDDGKQSLVLRLSCKFFKIEGRFIHLKALNVRYLDDGEKEVNQKIITN